LNRFLNRFFADFLRRSAQLAAKAQYLFDPRCRQQLRLTEPLTA
jgi:hypothetical protein